MIGFRICKNGRRIESATIDAFRALPVANVSDVMSRMYSGGADLKPYYSGERMVGRAITVKTRPGDNLVIHKALDLAEPGDIVVVDAGGDLTNALIGELMVAHAVARKLGGIVINGAIRDSDELSRGDFPVFAVGVTHRGPFKDGPGEVNTPISINGMVIEPGDLVLGDADGLLAVPFDDIEAVLADARKKQVDEVVILAETQAQTYDRSWIDKLLLSRGCVFE